MYISLSSLVDERLAEFTLSILKRRLLGYVDLLRKQHAVVAWINSRGVDRKSVHRL